MKEKSNKICFCNLGITNIDYNEIIEYIGEAIKNKNHLFIVPLSLKLFIKSIFSGKLRKRLNMVDLLIPSSQFLFFLIKLSHKNYRLKYSEAKDVISTLLVKYNFNKISYVFIGTTVNGLSTIAKNLKMSFKDINILGLYPEEFFLNKRSEIAEVLRKIEPNLVFVDYKEKDVINWVFSFKGSLKKSIVILCESKLKIMAGLLSDIPFKFKKRNIEYIYRLMNNPFRIFDILIFIFVFIYFIFCVTKKLFIKDKFQGYLCF